MRDVFTDPLRVFAWPTTGWLASITVFDALPWLQAMALIVGIAGGIVSLVMNLRRGNKP